MSRKYDLAEIDQHIARVHGKVGDAPFTSLGLMALEVLMREQDRERRLPSKTLLRERLNAFRVARWPALAPRKIARYW